MTAICDCCTDDTRNACRIRHLEANDRCTYLMCDDCLLKLFNSSINYKCPNCRLDIANPTDVQNYIFLCYLCFVHPIVICYGHWDHNLTDTTFFAFLAVCIFSNITLFNIFKLILGTMSDKQLNLIMVVSCVYKSIIAVISYDTMHGDMLHTIYYSGAFYITEIGLLLSVFYMVIILPISFLIFTFVICVVFYINMIFNYICGIYWCLTQIVWFLPFLFNLIFIDFC